MIDKMNSILNSVEYFSKTFERSIELIADGVNKQIDPTSIDNNTKYIIENLSKRNSKDSYIVNIDKSNPVYLNFIPSKTVVLTSELEKIKDIDFEYFVELSYEESEEIPFDVLDGTIIRVAASGDIKNQQYYIKDDGKLKPIPNFKTVQVMLAERGKIIEDVKIVESYQLEKILNSSDEEDEKAGGGGGSGGGGGGGNSPIPDKTSQWKPEMDTLTFSEVYAELAETAESSQAIIDVALDQAQQNIDLMKQDAETARAEADAAKAQADADKAAAELAIAEAEAEKAAAEAAKAEAEKVKTETETKKVTIQNNNQTKTTTDGLGVG